VLVLDAAGVVVAEHDGHASTVAGLAFSGDGTRIAASHYGGVTVWPADRGDAIGERLEWHGSHLAVAWSPDSAFIATAMQEKELHAWRMPHGKSLRMSGYPAKIRSLSWTPDGRYLAVGGADSVTAWDFGDGGPSGKAPLEFGYVFNQVVTEVAASPADGMIAGAYDDGAVMIGDPASGEAMIARAGDGAAVTRLVWSDDGGTLLAGSAKGGLAVMQRRDLVAAV
jgi:WD40 repeat protein